MTLQKAAVSHRKPRQDRNDPSPAIAAASWREAHQQLHIGKILAPIDFSQPSKKALQYAVAAAKEFSAELILVHVTQPYPLVPDLPAVTVELNEILKRDGVEKLKQLARTVTGVEFKEVVRVGNPAREIVAEAEAQNADLIIMSTHGRAGVAHWFIGSVAEQVVRLAKCPVLTLRDAERDFLSVPADDAEMNRIGDSIMPATGPKNVTGPAST